MVEEVRCSVVMSDRLNTIACGFDPRSPRISAFHIHEWIYENLHTAEENIRMIQVDGPRKRVYIKFTDEESMNTTIQNTEGQISFRHDNGEISKVFNEIAGMGTKKIRIASLPPQVKGNEIGACMSRYGEVKSIRDEVWTSAYRYKVYNGIRIVEIKLKQLLPSHMSIVGKDAIISYDGQPPTCYRCNETGHQQLECPRRKRLGLTNTTQPTQTWADIVSNKTQKQIYNTSVVQKSPNNEIGMKRISTLPEVNSERKN